MKAAALLLAAAFAFAPSVAAAAPAYGDAVAGIDTLARDGNVEAATRRLDQLGESGDMSAVLAAAKAWRLGLPEAGPLRRPRPDKARALLRRAATAPGAHQGRALYGLYELLLDPAAAEAALAKAVVLGDPLALLARATRSEDVWPANGGPASATATTLLKLAIAKGEPDALAALASLIKAGRAEGDFEPVAASALGLLEARARDEALAMPSRASAMADLASIYDIGLLAPADAERAADWRRQAALAGHFGANMDIAERALAAVPPRFSEAEAAYRRMIEAGHAAAAVRLAQLRLDHGFAGLTVKEARAWLDLAERVDNPRVLAIAARNAGASNVAERYLKRAEAAWNGDSGDALTLAAAYAAGRGVPPNAAKARLWHDRALRRGGPHARALRGGYRLSHASTDAEAADALAEIEHAAFLGSRAAMMLAGEAYAKGPAPDMRRALDYFRAAAARGSAAGANRAAFILDSGLGVERDAPAAFDLWRSAAQAGSRSGLERIAHAYQRGVGVGQQPALAVEWHRRAAAAGSTGALIALGRSYAAGFGVPVDYARAYRYFEDAAERGSAPAMVEAGRLLSAGLGLTRDAPAARSWFERAAAAGSASAMLELAMLNGDAQESPRDPARARAWLERAAAAGSTAAMANLAEALLKAPPGARDENRIRQLLEDADAAGEPGVDALLRKLDAAG